MEVQHHLFLTLALDGSGQPHASPLYPRELSVPIEDEAACVPQPVWTFRRTDKSLSPAKIRIPDRPARSLVTILTHDTIHFRANFKLN
jgi:hypothetical protein